jgi:hypothetical protein
MSQTSLKLLHVSQPRDVDRDSLGSPKLKSAVQWIPEDLMERRLLKILRDEKKKPIFQSRGDLVLLGRERQSS